MVTISLCMIVKNEEKTLNRCLQSVEDIPDEIIIVDTGSIDRTKEIAKKWTPHVYDFEWVYDFAAARNEAFRYATMDYIFWLDADDILTPADANKLRKLKNVLDPDVDAVSMKYHTMFDSNGNVTSSTRRLRLIKRTKPFCWNGIVHEDLVCSEDFSCVSSDICITHTKQTLKDRNRNIKIYERAIKKGILLSIPDTFHYARELTAHKQYEKAIEQYEACMDSPEISLENKTFMYHQLASCYALIGNLDKERELTLSSFLLDIPQPVFCCRMGEQFIQKKQYEQAAFWYELAINMQLPPRYEWSVSQQMYQTWVPHKQLALCCYCMGNYEKAYRHSQKVLVYQPNDLDTQANMLMLKELFEGQKN
ncbi:TPA: glycosyltransferase [Bacillus mobilis]